MGDGVEGCAKPVKVKPALASAKVAAEIADYTSGINVYALPVEVPRGCLLVSTLELEYYPSVATRRGRRESQTQAQAGRGNYWHVPVGRYRKGETELDLVLVISVFAPITEEDGRVHAELIGEALGIKEPSHSVSN